MNERTPPGPRGAPLVGNLPSFRRNALRMFMDGREAYGDIVYYRGPLRMYLLAHPREIAEVMEERVLDYPHPELFNRSLRPSVGDGVITVEGEAWLARRRAIDPVWSAATVADAVPAVVAELEAALECWRPFAERGEPLDLRVATAALSLAVLGRVLYGESWSVHSEELGPRGLSPLLAHADRRLASPFALPERVPTREHRHFRAARERFDRVTFALIAARRRSPAHDLLSRLVHAGDGASALDDGQVRDEVACHYLAGHGTVYAALPWACHALGRHPDVAEQVGAEADAVLGSDRPDGDSVARLAYARQVASEVLRLYPPLFLLGRSPLEDDEIAGYVIRARSLVALSPYVTHRHPEIWDDPESFDPERFAPGRDLDRPKWSYFPFSHGPRCCPGGPLADLLLTLFVALLARRYRLSPVPGEAVELQVGPSALLPRPRVLLRLEPRTAAR